MHGASFFFTFLIYFWEIRSVWDREFSLLFIELLCNYFPGMLLARQPPLGELSAYHRRQSNRCRSPRRKVPLS
ncbi:hypothetical protein BDY21DRAFT_109692 [Lineolata rhizophorae]|uniref:Uncharacterized protein n=1 Tax=Lineolata rhizophorae TaxID=578093 RepID=A0A6A6NS54_9PEZI|nr:hypothetical protein BDY21DRAFT_109692 [Lineolata rhizophorae]